MTFFNLRVEEYIRTGRDRNIVDPDPNRIYTKRKEHKDASDGNSSRAATSDSRPEPSFPSDGWSSDIKRMPFFTRAEMNNHISKSGKNIDSSSSLYQLV